jgi:hypothetical protein
VTEIKVKIKDLVDYFNTSDLVGTPMSVRDIKVKTPTGDLVDVQACIKKPKEMIIETVFSDGVRTVSVKSSKQHLLYNGVECQTVEEIEEIQLVDEYKLKKVSSTEIKEDYLYDISIPAPHLYVTPNGMIHHNTSYALLMAKGYLDKYEDGVVLFYDSEFGSPQGYWKSFGVDTSRVLHTPITNIEELKFDLMTQLEAIDKKDHVMVLIDSVGNLASKKEVEDALKESSAADMTRAKQLKSVFRMVTPLFKLKDIPCVAINHVYSEQGCLKGDTKILTNNGLKYIKDIKEGDFVKAKNDFQKVLKTFSHEELFSEEKKYLKITFEDGTFVECTDNHRFLTKTEDWVHAGDLREGVFLLTQ